MAEALWSLNTFHTSALKGGVSQQESTFSLLFPVLSPPPGPVQQHWPSFVPEDLCGLALSDVALGQEVGRGGRQPFKWLLFAQTLRREDGSFLVVSARRR